MRKTGALLIVVAALAAPAQATAARPQVTGSATNTFEGAGVNSLTIRAFADPLAGWAHGDGDFDGAGPLQPFGFTGRVTCVRIIGNHASVKYAFDESTGSGSGFAGGGVEVYVEDNGRTGDADATDPPQPAGIFQLTASQCDDPTGRPDYNPVDSGDFTVRR
jgi:hypothetical protein